MAANELPPLEVLQERFTADPDRGWLFFNVGNKTGRRAGYLCAAKQYRCVTVLGYGEFKEHRILYALYNGVLPGTDAVVDHKDRIKLNNKKSNLRLATHRKNAQNTNRRAHNTSGKTGVIWCKREERWIARINDANGKRIYIGRSKSFEVAAEMRTAYERKIGYNERS